MNPNQEQVKREIEHYSQMIGVDTAWALAIAMVESSMGEARVSATNCRGIYQMSSIAMEDLRLSMGRDGDDDLEILCGLLFLRLLFRRWGSIDQATMHFCDPGDRDFYLDRMLGYLQTFRKPVPAPPVASQNPANVPPKAWWERLWG